MDADLEVSNICIVQEGEPSTFRFDAHSPRVKEPRILRYRVDFVALRCMKDVLSSTFRGSRVRA